MKQSSNENPQNKIRPRRTLAIIKVVPFLFSRWKTKHRRFRDTPNIIGSWQ